MKIKKQDIGFIMALVPFVGVFIFGSIMIGLLSTLLLFMGVGFLVVWLMIAAKLIEKK